MFLGDYKGGGGGRAAKTGERPYTDRQTNKRSIARPFKIFSLFIVRPQRVLKFYWATRGAKCKPEKQSTSIIDIQAFTRRRCSRETRSRKAAGGRVGGAKTGERPCADRQTNQRRKAPPY